MSKNKNHNPETTVVHSGREPEKNFGVVNPPVYHASTILFETFQDFKKAEEGRLERAAYGRHGTQSYRLFEESLCAIIGSEKCLITNSGLNAIAITLTALLTPGDHILIVDSTYSPTRFFADQELKRFGVEVEYYAPGIGAGISKLIKKNTKVIYCESPGSLTFEVEDIPAIVKCAHEKNALVVLDNTWATPLFFDAVKHGVDISIHSATKYIGGHSDLMMGIISCSEKLFPTLKRSYKNFGIISGPDDIYLAQRGLRTLPTRLKAHEKAALDIAHWLKNQPQIARVLHPALPDCPGHELWKRDFTGSSGLFSFVLKKHLDEATLGKFLDNLQLFKMGYSWGGFESLIIPVWAEKIRSVEKFKPEGTAFRVSIGLENVDDLKADLANGLSALKN